ncbi:chromobox protein homolog 2-like [Portunus trituberculatus]|uniref:chromobox protein homolog 2-like n=1 Tax=Portunus trituberculatus TaxID=210409 RepID=UPI001E1D0F2B|nr:chromobox protein homolog 2-like [Portunus trituberculatus]
MASGRKTEFTPKTPQKHTPKSPCKHIFPLEHPQTVYITPETCPSGARPQLLVLVAPDPSYWYQRNPKNTPKCPSGARPQLLVLVAPDPSYWYQRNPLADEIFITDVTANLITVTIRECKKRQGFFKDNTDENQNSQSSIK